MSWGFNNAAPQTGGPQAAAGSDLQEITTNALGFQAHAGETKLKLLPQPWPEDRLPPNTASLLSIASRKGLLAAAGPDSLVIASTQAVRKAYHADVPANNNIKPFTPQATIPIQRLSQLAFSSDESCLVIAAEEGGGLAVYDVDSLLQGNQQSAFQMGTNSISVRALIQNPAPEFAHLFAVVLTDGKLMIANLKEKNLSNVFREGVSCVSWSAKGKQLVAGLEDGSAAQYDPQGVQKAQIPKPPQITDPLPVTAICWIANDDFFTIHTPVSGDSTDSIYHMINRAKGTGALTCHKLSGDPCPAYGMPRTPAQHFFARLRSYPPALDELLIVASTAAVDIGVVSKSSVSFADDNMGGGDTVNVFTTTGMADDTRRAQVPMSAADSMGDTSPIGMALDLSSRDVVVKPIPQEEMDHSSTPLPALMMLNNEGVLCTWWIVYNESIRKQTIYPGLVAASSDSTSTAQPSPFAAPAPAPTQSAFGAVSAPAQPAFGAPSFGKPAAPTFGSPATPGAFGGASALGSKSSPWGAAPASATPSAPAFGKPAFGSSTPIGAASSGSSGPFGAASGLGGKSSPWGAPVNTQPSTTSAFSQSASPFSATTASSGFAALGSKASNTPAFAAPGNDAKSAQSPFPTFGSTQPPGNKPSAFGSFGQKNDKPATGGAFGAASSMGVKSSPWGASTQPQSPAPASKEATMSDDEDSDTATDSNSSEKPAPSTSPFGQASKPQSPFAQFGSASGDKPKTSIFGQKSEEPSKQQSPFAQFANSKPTTSPFAQVGGEKPSTSPFAQAKQDKPSTSPFSSTISEKSKTIFGQSSEAPQTSIFGQPSQKPSDAPSSTSGFSEFKLGSTFAGDGSAKDDLPASKDAGKSLFDSTFGNALGEASKDTSARPVTPIKAEPDTEEEAPLPPDFVTHKPKNGEEDLPPIAGSPPVDLGETSSLRSSPVSSIEQGEAKVEGPFDEDDEEWDDEEEEEGEEGEEGEEEEDEDEEDEGDDDVHNEDEEDSEDDESDEDEEGPNEDDTVSRPPKTGQAGNAFASRLTFPSGAPSTTPAGLPKAPLFAPPSKKQESPRSPSPVRKDRLTAKPAAASSSRIAVPSIPSRPSSSISQRQSPAPVEPEEGELSDDEDARIQELLKSEPEATKILESFVAHQDYIGEISKPGIGGQIEKVYRDINSMIDTLALNVRSLEGFVKGHETLTKSSGRERSDLESAEDWCLVEIQDLGVVEKELGDSLDAGKITDVKSKLNETNEIHKDTSRLRSKTAEMRKQIATRTDPEQRSNHRAAMLNTEAQMQQAELRQSVAKVQTLLQEAEEALSVLRVDLATASAATNGNAATQQRTPTVEAITNTILKMTAMVEQKSGDVDVLEAQIRRLPQGLAGLSLDDGTDLRSSVRSMGGAPFGTSSIFATPPTSRPRNLASSTSLGMSGRFQTPQTQRNQPVGLGFASSVTPDASAEFGRSTRSLTGSSRKKMIEVSQDEIWRYLGRQEQRARVLAALKATVEKKGTRSTRADK